MVPALPPIIKVFGGFWRMEVAMERGLGTGRS